MKTKAVFTKIEMNNEWNIIFLQNSLFGIQQILASLPLVKAPPKLHLMCEAVPLYFFNVLHILLYTWI